jgi:hypothetical protein
VTEPAQKPGQNATLDQSPVAIAGAAMIVSLYGVLALAMLGMALYFAIAKQLPITSPKVFVALIGSIYLALRAFMLFKKRSQKKTDHAG